MYYIASKKNSVTPAETTFQMATKVVKQLIVKH